LAAVRLFCLTKGYSNDVLHAGLRLRRPPRRLWAGSVVADLTPDERAAAVQAISDASYFRFPNLLDPALCDELTSLANRSSGYPSPERSDGGLVRFRDSPESAQVKMFEDQIASARPVQELVADPGLLDLAQAYLQCEPILAHTALWWTRAHGSTDQTRVSAGQLFHFDLDRVKWLKFLIYLTDVDESTGPHVVVSRSHRSGSLPWQLGKRGYVRYTDSEVLDHYDREDIVELTGPRGTVLAVDTRALHRGKPLQHGERLILGIEYSDSLLGGSYQRIDPVVVQTDSLWRAAVHLPHTYRRWVLN
jgi:hypothetical protein